MTENEAIVQLNFDMEMIRFNPDTGETLTLEQIKAHNEDNYKTYLADEVAITALLEIQQYRAIGTVEDFKALKENKFFNFDSPVARVDKKSYDKAIDDLCNEFHKDWEEQSENDMEDCINWYDWLIACAEQLKGE